MVTSIYIISICVLIGIYILMKVKRDNLLENNYSSIIGKLITLTIVFLSIPYMYISISLLTNNFYVTDIDSNMESFNIEPFYKGKYIGELHKDNAIIYQKGKDIKIPREELMILTNNNIDTTTIEKININASGKVKFTNKFNEFLAKDYKMYDFIMSRNSEIADLDSKIYSITSNNEKILKEIK